jgi:peptidase M23-like protein
MASHRTTARAFLLLLLVGAFTGTANAAVEVPDVTAFPVVGNVSYIDDFGDPRPQGPHEGNDIMSVRHQPAVAFVPGRVEKWTGSGSYGTCMLYLHAKNGMTYVYIHLNNDLGPTNDNEGGCKNGVSWAKGLDNGDHVSRGELVGFVGDSGDANGIQPHLHFEVRKPSGRAIDPFKYLNRSKRLLFPKPRPGLGDVTLTLKRAEVLETTDTTLTVRTKRIVVEPLGLSYVNRRKVIFAVPAETQVERKGVSGLSATAVTSAQIGERVRVVTVTFTPTWTLQKAPAESISTSKIVLLGD